MTRTPASVDLPRSGVKPSIPASSQESAQDTTANPLMALDSMDRATLERTMTAGQLAGMFAHELSNILTPLLSYAQLALAQPDDEALSHKALTKAAEGAQRAAFLVDALLGKRGGPETRDRDAESATSPLLSLAPACEVGDCVRHSLSAVFRAPGAAMDRSRIAIELDLSPNMHAAIHPIALEQVLHNLLNNARLAVRELPDASIRVEVGSPAGGCSTGNSADGRIEIRVRDSGYGVPDHLRARLFEPFVSSRAGQGGFGLGLAVCKRLVEQAGGTITLEPASEHAGASFLVTLPRARQPVAATPDTDARRLAA
ncbi:MAG: HAMP domain-containing histidine kinase [Phycisphaeraceae bacterium]|nr:HAMP domain-containing histidine kinase [Phycisphaeraceae bacterium]